MKTIKHLLTILIILVLFTSCDGYDEYGCYESVKKEFPDAIEIERIPYNNYTFIVKNKDSTTYYVKTMNITNTNITLKHLLFK